MPEIKSISPADLMFDSTNPRLVESSGGQREIQRAIAENQQSKLAKLAADIVAEGVDPSTLPIVMPNKGQHRRYTVLEGNRRLAAIRSMEAPEAIVGTVGESVLRKIREASRDYLENPIQEMNCLVVKNRDEARHWIELRHTGENEGAGLVRWGSDESARFRTRSGKYEPHSQAFDFLENQGMLTSAERSKVPATSIKRLLTSRDVRDKLGVDVVSGELRITGDTKKVARALKHIMDDFSRDKGEMKVGDIYTKEQRTAYAKNLPKSIVVKSTGASRKVATSSRRGGKKKTVKKKRRRDQLIPDDCQMNVTDERCSDIENELRVLRLDDHTNAIAVLFRVFLELSTDNYIDIYALNASSDDTLSKKMRTVLAHLLKHDKLTEAQARPVRRAVQKDSFLAPSVKLMHMYVHNQHVFPAPEDLRAHWNNLQRFITAMWS